MATPGKPKSPDTEKNKKYDRQLRLWGDHGQQLLENAHVCLINATATGTETLKNLILPGIGAFTIVDNHEVTIEDVGNNFFLERQYVGMSRAQVATNLLQELNSDVRGEFVEESVENLLRINPNFFSNFTVVIATNLNEKNLFLLSQKLWEVSIPLIVCRSYGFVGYMRLQIEEHTVIEAHPDNQLGDLRLDNQFPSLKAHIDQINLDTLDNKEHSHIPYLVIISKFLNKWRKQNEGRYPLTYKEKSEVKEMIKAGVRLDKEGFPLEEENFTEAVKALNTALTPTKVPHSLEKILNDSACLNLNSESKPFWILAHALKLFINNEGEGVLPLRGVIPDMTSDSQSYIKLQTIYKQEALKHADIIRTKVHNILTHFERPQDLISESDIHLFCKNATNLKVIRGTSIVNELNSTTAKVHEIVSGIDNPNDNEMIYYLLLRAVDRFHTQHNRYPGFFSQQVEADVIKLKGCLTKLLQELGIGPLNKDDFIYEMCRFGASELPTVAAFIGGCASHEVIKLLTKQYIPFHNTYIYNSATCTSATFSL